MTKEKLAKMLGSLPIHNPDVNSVKGLFPHLSPKEIQEILTIGEKGKPISVAMPHLDVNGAYHIVSLNPKHGLDYLFPGSY